VLDIVDIEDKKLNIEFNRQFKNASEAETYIGSFEGEKKVIKLFTNRDSIDNKIKKIQLIKNRLGSSSSVVTADSFISKNNEIIGYFMPFVKGTNIYFNNYLNKEQMISYLKQISKEIKKVHDKNIVLADFHSNIIYDENQNIHFIDHDNFAIDDYDVDLKNIYLHEYQKHIKTLDKNFDRYLLNIYTISFFKNIFNPYIYLVYIGSPEKFNFKDEEITKIFYNTMRLNKTYDEDVIIDKINNVKDLKKIKTRFF